MTKKIVKKGVAPTAADFNYEYDLLPYCCGVTVVGEFGTDEYSTDGELINWAIIPAVMAAGIRREFNDLGKTLVATTVLRYSRSGKGQDEVNKVLSRTGWKKVKDFTNKGTGSRLRMWIFTPTTR